MTVIKVVRNWFHWRNDPANNSDIGYVPIHQITAVHHSSLNGNSYVTIHTMDGCAWQIENVTVEEVMTVLRTATDDTSSLEIITQQTNRIRELEALLEAKDVRPD